jgi:hypothetical protein
MLKMRNEVLPQVACEQATMEPTETGEKQATAGGLNRRNFLFTAGLTAGAVGALGMTAGCGSVLGVDPSSGPAPSIAAVLNFALNLEYLEANFYSYITTGAGIPTQYGGTNPGKITGGGPAVNFSDPVLGAFAKELAADEMAHVMLLRSGLIANGITPVDQPALDLSALGAVTDDASFLAIARALETTGTSAYEGGIQYLTASIAAVNYAALIHVAEGEHEGVLRQFCISKGVMSPAVDSYDRPPELSDNQVFNTSLISGLNTARNASEVLRIVYAAPGSTGVSSGGFFPSGLNGSITTT